MKAVFFDPYLETVGGGERYTLTLAEYLSKNNWQVDVLWNDSRIKDKIISRLKLDLEKINFVNLPQNIFQKSSLFGQYDLCFWLSDGSIPLLFSKKNILHFQVPFQKVGGKSLSNRLKFKKINHLVCNSMFTKKFIDREYGVNSQVIYPPVDIESFKPGRKENIILSVGRFSQLLQAKRQDVLIKIFGKMIEQGLTGWKLILAGATDVGGKEYYESLKIQAQNYPIELIENIDFPELQSLYGKAKIFWNASGFGIDEEKEPEKTEHFGMVVVEAMAAGCVPVVVGKGGIREIISEGKTGFLWEKEEDLKRTTLDLIKEAERMKKISLEVVKSSQKFSKERFCQEFNEII